MCFGMVKSDSTPKYVFFFNGSIKECSPHPGYLKTGGEKETGSWEVDCDYDSGSQDNLEMKAW